MYVSHRIREDSGIVHIFQVVQDICCIYKVISLYKLPERVQENPPEASGVPESGSVTLSSTSHQSVTNTSIVFDATFVHLLE